LCLFLPGFELGPVTCFSGRICGGSLLIGRHLKAAVPGHAKLGQSLQALGERIDLVGQLFAGPPLGFELLGE